MFLKKYFSTGTSKKYWIEIKRKRYLFLFLSFVVGLLLVLQFRQPYVGYLSLHQKSDRNVIANTSFSFPDIETTNLLKQQLFIELGNIYLLDAEQVRLNDLLIEEELTSSDNWRNELPTPSFEEVYECKNLVMEELLVVRVARAKMIQKMELLGLPIDHCVSCEFLEPSNEVLGRCLWDQIEQKISTYREWSPGVLSFVLKKFTEKPWHLIEDLQTKNKIRQEIKINLPLKLTHVKEGSWIIRSGDRVTNRHLDIMKAYRKAVMSGRHFSILSFLGSGIIALSVTFMLFAYLYARKPQIFRNFRKLALLVTIVMLSLLIAKTAEYIILNYFGHLNTMFSYPIFVLFGALLTSLLLGSEIAFVVSILLTVILEISFVVLHDFFVVMNLTAACLGILSVRQIRHRKEIFQVTLKVLLSMLPIIIAICCLNGRFWDTSLFGGAIAAFVFVTLLTIAIVGILPVLESMFDVWTDMSLMEFSNPNQPLLKRLAIEAPGTYQHSYRVGELAEAAALSIGSNGIFCKVAALYHDIGKLSNPRYFSENQIAGFDMHRLLPPIESVQIILKHVPYGVGIGKEHKLPRDFIDIIREHHGTSLAYCFYQAQIKLVGDSTLVDPAQFRYAGPRPRSKESAIIMIADTVEAAFSALKDKECKDELFVTEFVEQLVNNKAIEGEFRDSFLCFEELERVKKSFVQKLISGTRGRTNEYPPRDNSKRDYISYKEESETLTLKKD